MGCNTSKDVSLPIIITENFDSATAVNTVKTNMEQAKYKTLTDYLTEATKCLLLLVQELKEDARTEATHRQGQKCDLATLRSNRNRRAKQFRCHMSKLGFFSKNTTAFNHMTTKLLSMPTEEIINEVIYAILICIYLISILHDVINVIDGTEDTEDNYFKLNNYFKRNPMLVNPVANPSDFQKKLNVNNGKFDLLKKHLLYHAIEEQYEQIYNTHSLREGLIKMTSVQKIAEIKMTSVQKIPEIDKAEHPHTDTLKKELTTVVEKATIQIKEHAKKKPRQSARLPSAGSTTADSKASASGGSATRKTERQPHKREFFSPNGQVVDSGKLVQVDEDQIKQIRKLLTNKKLTEKQKEQYKRKINKLKLKIAKEQKLNKINKIKDKLKKANTNLKRKKLTDKQKQQLQIKIKNYKNQIKKLSS